MMFSCDVVCYVVDFDVNDGVCVCVVKYVFVYGKLFDVECVSVSLSGRYACASGERDEGSGARVVVVCYVVCFSVGVFMGFMGDDDLIC